MVYFGPKGGSFIQESQLFFPGAFRNAKFHSRILLLHSYLSGDFFAKLLVCTELQKNKADDEFMLLHKVYHTCIQYDISVRCVAL